MVAAGLNTTQTISVAVGGVVAPGVIVAIFNVWSTYLHERRHTQPVVIAHERHGRQFSDNPSCLAVGGYITHDGSGPAFNVRFGVEFGGVRYPQKQFPHDPDSRNVERVLPVNQRRPGQNASPDSWPILIPQQSLLGTTGSDELDDSRVY